MAAILWGVVLLAVTVGVLVAAAESRRSNPPSRWARQEAAEATATPPLPPKPARRHLTNTKETSDG